MSAPVSVVIVAINGYGAGYLRLLLDEGEKHGARIAGVVDPAAEQNQWIDEIRARGIPVYLDTADFYKDHKADLAIFSTPIQLHCRNVKLALENGSNVLCEKPLCATVDEGYEMKRLAESSDKFVAIGYNWSYAPTIQAVKADILAGMYGAPVRMKCMVSWPRNSTYYARNNWAGGLKSARGEWILDSPLNNATAHFLHNIFYICGKTRQTSAKVLDVRAELYRANQITSFDTCCLRCHLEDGVEVMYYTTHASTTAIGPIMLYEFEKGAIYSEGTNSPFVGRLTDGTLRRYEPCPDMNGHTHKLWQCIEHCRDNGIPACGVDAALQHTLVVNGAHLSMPEIINFPQNLVEIKQESDGVTIANVPNLAAWVMQCFSQRILFSEHGAIDFARPGKDINLCEIKSFNI